MYNEKINAYIDSKKEEMLEDLMILVRINSQRQKARPGQPYGKGPARALKTASKLMRKYGLSVTNYDNYVVTGDFGPGEKELDILAHLDVVPASDNWTVTRPFKPLIRDGRIYGRGTSDDKGPAIAALYAIRAVKDLKLPLQHSVRLILGSDEECGSSDLEHYYAAEEEAPCTFTPDSDFPLINLEKARLEKHFSAKVSAENALPCVLSIKAGTKSNVVPDQAQAVTAGLTVEEILKAAEQAQEKTGATFTAEVCGEGLVCIHAFGLAAHAMAPENGNNAATALLVLLAELPLANGESTRLIKALKALFVHGETAGKTIGIAQSNEKSGSLTMNLGILTLENGVLRGVLDLRIPLGGTDENVTFPLHRRLEEAGLTPDDTRMIPVHYVPEDSHFVQTLLKAYEDHFGKKGEALYTGGGTYVHHLKRGVAFGCAIEEVDNHMHGDDEFMEIDTLIRSAKLFADVIVRLCG